MVPRIYLKHFSINGKQTYAYIKNLGECKLVSIKDVAVKENFYIVHHKNIEPHYIESYLSAHIEPLLGKCICSIIQYANNKKESLNLYDICRSIICQYYRGSDKFYEYFAEFMNFQTCDRTCDKIISSLACKVTLNLWYYILSI